MKRIAIVLPLLFAILMLAVACAQSAGAPSTTEGACPTPGEGTALYTLEDLGYCVLYPSTHQPFETDGGSTTFAVDSLQDASSPRISIVVTDVAGEDTTAAADRIEADFAMPDMSTRGNITLGGQEAVLLDNMPGQDINRRVIVVHNGRLYDLTFSPIGAEYGEVAEQTEQVYQMVLDSFSFLP